VGSNPTASAIKKEFNMLFYKEIDLPSIPEELLVFNPVPHKIVKDIGYKNNIFKNGKKVTPCGYINSFQDSNQLRNWFNKNVFTLNEDTFILKQISRPRLVRQSPIVYGEASTHIVHVDIRRQFGLNYIIDPGGDNVITSWYQEKGLPIKRVKLKGGSQAEEGSVVQYDNLKVLESTKFEANKWYLLATDILHDVDNITRDRVSITFSFWDDSVLDKLKI